MSKKKINELVKAVMAAALCIGLFSAVFVGVNALAYASVTGKTDNVQLATASVDIPAERTAPEGYVQPTLSVYEAPNEWYIASADALTPEEAAELGAQYIWEVFGESIDGKAIEMFYSAWPSHTRAYCHGLVLDKPRGEEPVAGMADLREEASELFNFTLDAVTGERISLYQDLAERYDALKNDLSITTEERLALRKRYALYAESNAAADLMVPPHELKAYAQIAEEYAQRHFHQSTVTNVAFASAQPYFAGLHRQENQFGDREIVPQYQIYHFTVTDNLGREAEVAVISELKQLYYLSTQDNDIVPGFTYNAPDSLG